MQASKVRARLAIMEAQSERSTLQNSHQAGVDFTGGADITAPAGDTAQQDIDDRSCSDSAVCASELMRRICDMHGYQRWRYFHEAMLARAAALVAGQNQCAQG